LGGGGLGSNREKKGVKSSSSRKPQPFYVARGMRGNKKSAAPQEKIDVSAVGRRGSGATSDRNAFQRKC